jgi:hypothetical protein
VLARQMDEGRKPDRWDEVVVRIDHLERRRTGNDQAMWLAPVLTVTGQAFLLQVLASDI